MTIIVTNTIDQITTSLEVTIHITLHHPLRTPSCHRAFVPDKKPKPNPVRDDMTVEIQLIQLQPR